MDPEAEKQEGADPADHAEEVGVGDGGGGGGCAKAI